MEGSNRNHLPLKKCWREWVSNSTFGLKKVRVEPVDPPRGEEGVLEEKKSGKKGHPPIWCIGGGGENKKPEETSKKGQFKTELLGLLRTRGTTKLRVGTTDEKKAQKREKTTQTY